MSPEFINYLSTHFFSRGLTKYKTQLVKIEFCLLLQLFLLLKKVSNDSVLEKILIEGFIFTKTSKILLKNNVNETRNS